MSEKLLVLVKDCGECGVVGWNIPWMNYLKGRIVRIERFPHIHEYRVKTSSKPVRDRKYWIMDKKDFIIITPEIRAKLIDQFKKDRTMFVLKDKKKE